MPKVSDEYREARRAEIADAALRTFVAKGFQRTSIADIIAESGLSAGAIYGHFASKQEIMFAVANRVLGNRSTELRELGEQASMPGPGDMLAQMLHGLSDDLPGTQLLVQVWGESTFDDEMKGLVTIVAERLRSIHVEYLRLWAVKERGMSETDAAGWAENLAPVLLALGQGYILQRALFKDFDGEAYLAAARELLPR